MYRPLGLNRSMMEDIKWWTVCAVKNELSFQELCYSKEHAQYCATMMHQDPTYSQITIKKLVEER